MDIVAKGIDVSRWQGSINWPSVKADNIDFAIIRAGYCGYAGGISQDVQYKANMEGAADAGVDAGIYLYSYARTEAAAVAAARATLELAQDYQLNYPVAFDIEDNIYLSMGKAANTAIAKAFLSTIADAGYCPMLYSYKAFAEGYLDMDALSDYDFWLAHITSQTNYAGPHTIWQYSWTGSVSGISGDVDLNYCYKDYPAFIKENGLNGYDSDTGEPGDPDEEDGGTEGTPNPEPEPATYVVMKNDTLTHIAQRFGIPLRTLLQSNPQIKNPNLIYPGDVITIPAKPAG